MWRCRSIYWRLRWAFSHKAWNKLIYALHGNMESDVAITVFTWNGRGLPADAKHPKWRWIFEQLESWDATITSILEVEGGCEEYKGLRKEAARGERVEETRR